MSRTAVRLGLRANWRQFGLLVLVNGFVGAMIGLERAVLPVVGRTEFGVASATALLTFIATFGLTKAFANLLSGWLADRYARKPVLLLGWLVALPVPLLIASAPHWGWIVFANALLGINQGLAWSMTVTMKIDLAGPERRGLAMGLNEFAGYVAVAGAGVLGGLAVSELGGRAGLAWPALAIAAAGLGLSLLVRETRPHAERETAEHPVSPGEATGLGTLLRRSLWKDPGLFSVSQAGFVNNLNDGLAWGIFPLLFAASGMGLREIGILAALYPATWGICQLGTGALSDLWGRKPLLVLGMLLQGVALLGLSLARGFGPWAGGLVLLGAGTALVYPTLIAAVGDLAHPSWRGAAVGVYRLWRDLGYVAGALLAGLLADRFGMSSAVALIGGLTLASGLVVGLRFRPPVIRLGPARPVWRTP